MSDEDWDIKAFPHLHNQDGSNGKDQEQLVRLSEQNYFINRVCNLEKRFAKSSASMYAAVAYIETKQTGTSTWLVQEENRLLVKVALKPMNWRMPTECLKT